MPNRSAHVLIGVGVGIVASGALGWMDRRSNGELVKLPALLGRVSLGAAIGGLAAMLPDILEPATHPGHRQFFHSIVLLGAIILGSYALGQRFDMSALLKGFMLAAVVGYGSHLIADGLTPSGLPLLGR
jgi:inner membrane protein